MRYEFAHGISVPKLGAGTWSLGGKSAPDRSETSVALALAALHAAIEIGYRHFDTAEIYARGHCEELVGRAIRESRLPRGSFFITTKVSPEHLEPKALRSACERSLQRLGLEYIDLYLIHWPARRSRYLEAFQMLDRLGEEQKVRSIGVSNFGLELLRDVTGLSAAPVLTNQVPFSLADRSYVSNGVVEYCRRNDILVTAYSPLDQGRFKPGPVLESVARAHDVSPAQAALAWVMAQPGMVTIPMSSSATHLQENWASMDIELSSPELESLNST